MIYTKYYYNSINGWHNIQTDSYFYYDSVGTSWKSVNQVPAYYKSNKNLIYYNGSDVWMNNATDIKQYGKPLTPGTANSAAPKRY